jgi:hypothetical protein
MELPNKIDDIEDFANRIQSSKPLINEKIINIITEEAAKKGLLSLSHKINGLNSKKAFRGSISIYLMRSWIEDGPVTTSKWIRVPKKPGSRKTKRVPAAQVNSFEDRPVSSRQLLMTISNNKVVGQFDPEEWKTTVAQFSTVYTMLQALIDELQKDKLQDVSDYTPEQMTEVLSALDKNEEQPE